MPVFIGIAGPSGAGKTTVCHELKERASEFEHVRLDNYLRNPKFFPLKNGFVNWEAVQNIRFHTLLRHLRALAKGKSVRMKVSEKIAGARRTVVLRPRRFIVVEGFMTMKRKALRDFFDLKIFMDIPPELIIARRKKRYGQGYFEEYDREVVIPEFLRNGTQQKEHCDYVLDGSKSSEEVLNNLQTVLRAELM